MSDNPNNSTSIAIDFIDPLFAVVISISFIEVMAKPWFTQYPSEWQASYVFNIVTLFLGYSTVVLSWVGYHRSIKTKPIKINTALGFWRFIFDIGLLFFYWILLVKFESFWLVLLTLVVVYWIFVIWDILKWLEYKDTTDLESRRRRRVSAFWAIAFSLIFVFYLLFGFADTPLDAADWLFLIGAHGATVLYRIHKSHLRSKVWTVWLDLLAFKLPQKGEEK